VSPEQRLIGQERGIRIAQVLFTETPVDTEASSEVVGIVQNSGEHMLSLV
jgi:hypothetical protein